MCIGYTNFETENNFNYSLEKSIEPEISKACGIYFLCLVSFVYKEKK